VLSRGRFVLEACVEELPFLNLIQNGSFRQRYQYDLLLEYHTVADNLVNYARRDAENWSQFSRNSKTNLFETNK
jgi:hypothetical protein